MDSPSLHPRLSLRWKGFLALATIAGILLRIFFVEDMEFKEDEQYNFVQTRQIGISKPWPWIGMPSGVYLPNPGMSIWVFVWLARIFHATDPLQLALALRIFSLMGIFLILPFVFNFLKNVREKELWLWAYALAMVNPFAVFYQRKLWPEPFLPFFTMLMLMGWWKRGHWLGAFVWGGVGALLGQIHMSGFFFAAGFFFWTLIFARKSFRLSGWVLGSVIGALSLIPWVLALYSNPPFYSVPSRWGEAAQLKFWVFWITDALGLHLGNPLGLHRGPSHWDQISDFVRYPVLGGQATYLNGLAHLAIAVAAIVIVAQAIEALFRSGKSWRDILVGRPSDTEFAQRAALVGFGVFMTITGIVIRRYYMMVSFPFEFLWLAGLAFSSNPKSSKKWLSAIWVSQTFVSACFVGYIHVNQGALLGDYGAAYHEVIRVQKETTGVPWPGYVPPESSKETKK